MGDIQSLHSQVPTSTSNKGVFTLGNLYSTFLCLFQVYPALLKYALENHKKGQKFIISSSCNIEKQYCHHYVVRFCVCVCVCVLISLVVVVVDGLIFYSFCVLIDFSSVLISTFLFSSYLYSP